MKILHFQSFDSNNILSEISTNRTYLMGIAMLFVIIYHLFCWVYNPIGRLNIGYVGVDIFLFLSGLGLAHSYEKNKIYSFYKNRLKRIYPIYFIAVLLTFCVVNWSIKDLFHNLLTIGFYTNGGIHRYDWYVESLFTLYLLFPLFYCYSKLKYYGFTILFAVVALILYFFDISWWYDCFIARLPIFLYGIIFKKCYNSFRAISLIGIILYIPCRTISVFLASSLLALPIMIQSICLITFIKPNIKHYIEFCGRYSLEIYCANCLMHKVIDLYCNSVSTKFTFFVILQVLFSIVFIITSRTINKILIIGPKEGVSKVII